MTDEEFFDLACKTKLSTRNREAARLVLVEKLSQTVAAAEIGISKQRLTQIMRAIRTAEQKRADEAALEKLRQGTANIAVLNASYAFAVKAAREHYGDETHILTPKQNGKTVGQVIARMDFHLVQSAGRGTVVIHELAKLDKAPAIGENVAIDYTDGRGIVSNQGRENQRSAITR